MTEKEFYDRLQALKDKLTQLEAKMKELFLARAAGNRLPFKD